MRKPLWYPGDYVWCIMWVIVSSIQRKCNQSNHIESINTTLSLYQHGNTPWSMQLVTQIRCIEINIYIIITFLGNFNPIKIIFIQWNVFEHVACEMLASLSLSQCVKGQITKNKLPASKFRADPSPSAVSHWLWANLISALKLIY